MERAASGSEGPSEKVKKAPTSPTSFDIHEWAIMERFSQEWANPQERDELVRAIHGAGAFRRFKEAIRRLEIEAEWYRFHDAALEAIAKEWLEAHGIAYR